MTVSLKPIARGWFPDIEVSELPSSGQRLRVANCMSYPPGTAGEGKQVKAVALT